ncbi:hypothetical protein WJX74_006981 [Apatococcus lobatus]|uniref:Uncharacterized protein n=1 Tax=Apatococcus lobatus TaxID=904363 RepID=A0AAW1RDL8_9CHLO
MQVEASKSCLTRPETQLAPCRLSSSAVSSSLKCRSRVARRPSAVSSPSCRTAPRSRSCSTCSAAERPDPAFSSTEQTASPPSSSGSSSLSGWLPLLCSSPALLSLLALPAQAADVPQLTEGGFSKSSYYVTLGLFLLSVPGLYSLVKRAPKAKRKRITFEVAGPSKSNVPLDARARSIFAYFKKYNYEVVETGDVIKFKGQYKASRGQAAAISFYVFVGMASTALVLSIAAPFGGTAWYGLTALSPVAGYYYFTKGTRPEEFQVKMVTDDDDARTEIRIEGDPEEAERMRKELGLAEKGKVYVKGLLES